ncbi:MAG: hypothetical protein ACKVS8_03330 [Phycisphaerales bacterium]
MKPRSKTPKPFDDGCEPIRAIRRRLFTESGGTWEGFFSLVARINEGRQARTRPKAKRRKAA